MTITLSKSELDQAILQYLATRMGPKITAKKKALSIKLRRRANNSEDVGSVTVEIPD